MSSVWLAIGLLSFFPFAGIFEILGKWDVRNLIRIPLSIIAASVILLAGLPFVIQAAANVNCGKLLSDSPLWLSVIANTTNYSIISNTMARYMVHPTDAVIAMNFANSNFPGLVHVGAGDSLAAVNTQIANAAANGNNVIAYDFEHWQFTPGQACNAPFTQQPTSPPNAPNCSGEQGDPIGSADSAANATHNAGLLFAWNPDGLFMLSNTNPSTGHQYYKDMHWTHFDYLILQLQAPEWAGGSGSCGCNLTAFSTNLSTIVTYAKAQNPQLKIFEQLSLKWDAPSVLISKTQIIQAQGVDGVVYYFFDKVFPCPSSNCNPAALQTVLQSLRPTL